MDSCTPQFDALKDRTYIYYLNREEGLGAY